jgi:hypothetical protein
MTGSRGSPWWPVDRNPSGIATLQIWMTYEELAGMLDCTVLEARERIHLERLDRNSRDGKTCASSILLAPSAGNAVAVALAPSKLVGVVETGRARLECDRIDAIAGVMVLSEVARRLMMISGSGASTCAAECGRAATGRLTEVTTTAVPAGHRQPGGPDQELAR